MVAMKNEAPDELKTPPAEQKPEQVNPAEGEALPSEKPPSEETGAAKPDKQPRQKKRWIDNFLPKSREGRIILANSIAQLVSMVVAPLLVLVAERFAKTALKRTTGGLARLFSRHMDAIERVIRRPWKSSLSEQSLKRWENGSDEYKGNYLASVTTNLGLQTASNVGVTVASRLVLDRVFDTKMGARSIITSQALDTAVVLGGMVALPSLLPTPTRNARENLQSYLKDKQANGHAGWRALLGKNPNAPRQFALNSVNFSIPDLAGFSVGTAMMLYNARKQQQREQAESASPQR
jgi:hypothetical protein